MGELAARLLVCVLPCCFIFGAPHHKSPLPWCLCPRSPLLPLCLAPLAPVAAAEEPGPLGSRDLLPVQTGKLLGEVLRARAMPRGSAPSLLTPSWISHFPYLQRILKLKQTILHAFQPHNCI